MNKKIILAILPVILMTTAVMATPNWDITGEWIWNYYYGSGTYTHTMIVDVFNPSTGDFSGYGHYNANPAYTWIVTGNVDGDNIDFYIDYTGLNPSYYVDGSGTISSSTYMSGDAIAPGQEAIWDATKACSLEDSDEDGVDNCNDICPEETGEDKPSERLGTNRWIFNGQSWETGPIPGKGKGPNKSYTLDQTHGCSCFQILDWLCSNYPEEYGNMLGHYKFGCSISVMDDFISLTE
jgi:hypothetical protein